MSADMLLIGLPAVLAALCLILAGLAGLGVRALISRTDRKGVIGAGLTTLGALGLASLFAFVAIFQMVVR